MDENVLKINGAGYFHDVGKLVDRDELQVSESYIRNNADIYQPFYNGRHTHPHGLLTAAFIEQYRDILPAGFNSGSWGTGDSFINLAACHHKPETPLQWVVSIADRLSSGWDRKEFEDDYNQQVDFRDYKKTRMVPLLEKISPNPEHDRISAKYDYAYPLEALGPLSVFPYGGADPSQKSNAEARDEYKELFRDFIRELALLGQREGNIELWFENFDSLLMKYASCVPAARAGKVIPDVSLYDHCRSTASLATAIYLFHRENGSLTADAIKKQDDPKFLIILGDFFGIQDFILKTSGDLRKLRSKLLRGRSFTVSLLCELAADMLCREAGLPFSSVVLNAAGKFTIIAPNISSTTSAIKKVTSQINGWLTKIAFGQSAIGFAHVEASAKDFIRGGFTGIRDRLQQKMERQKLNRIDLDNYGGVASDYLDSFNNKLSSPLCPLCGKRPSDPEVENTAYIRDVGSACKICRDHVYIGASIVKKDNLAVYTASSRPANTENSLMAPIFDHYQIGFYHSADTGKMMNSGGKLREWDISLISDSKWKTRIARKFINAYIPVYDESDMEDDRYLLGDKSEEKTLELIDAIKEGQPKTFGHISALALAPRPDNPDKFSGVDALGVIKADVDNLGALMTCGLQKGALTVSRLATLSRQINFFFGLYLPYLLQTNKQFNNIYTVFAGGDDLFLIGPWNAIVELSRTLSDDFANYVCHNVNVHFSAGIVFRKANTPVDQMAETAEKELGLSKERGKDRVSMFDQTVTWKQISELSQIRQTLMNWRSEGLINNAMLYRLNELMEMAGKEKLLGKSVTRIADLACTKWRSQLAYTVERNVAREISGEARREKVANIHVQLAQWLMKYGSELKIPVWELLYSIR